MDKSNELKRLEKRFRFTLEPTGDRLVDLVKFDDGKVYRLQRPSFMELHNMLTGSDNLDHVVFEWGLGHLYPDNPESPRIDSEYLENNRREGFALWSILIRERLLSG